MVFALAHTHSSTLTLLAPFNYHSDILRCEAFPKPNQYNIQMRAYTNSCNLMKVSESIEDE